MADVNVRLNMVLGETGLKKLRTLSKGVTHTFKVMDSVFKGVSGLEKFKKQLTFMNLPTTKKKLNDLNLEVRKGGAIFDKTSNELLKMKDVMGLLYNATGKSSKAAISLAKSWKTFNKVKKPITQVTSMDKLGQELSSGIQKRATAQQNLEFINQSSILKKLGYQYDSTGQKILKNGKSAKVTLASLRTELRGLSAGKLNMLNKELFNFNAKAKDAQQGARRFKMELLGIMFFGMAMANMFKNMLQPAADAMGIMDIFSTTLLVMFLPIMEQIQPKIFEVLDSFMNLSDKTKLLIGWFAVGGFIIGTFLFMFGQIGLGVSSLIMQWPTLMAALGKVVNILKLGTIFTKLGGIITSFLSLSVGAMLFWIIIIVAILALLYVAWTNNWGNIKKHTESFLTALKTFIIGAFETIYYGLKFVWDLVIAIFTGNWEPARESAKKFLEGLEKMFWGIIGMVASPLAFVRDLFVDFFTWLNEKADYLVPDELISGLEKLSIPGLADNWGYKDRSSTGAGSIASLNPLKEGETRMFTDFRMGVSENTPTVNESSTQTTIINNSPIYNVSGNFTDDMQRRTIMNDTNNLTLEELKKLNIRY